MEEVAEVETDRAIAATFTKSIGFKRIDVVLDHSQKVYYSGREISGNVHLELEEPTSALGIRLKCKGEAQVYFTDRSAGIRRKLAAFENYLHVERYVVGDGKEKCVITGGVYPFALTLPSELPCSFEGRYGRVRYSIRALLDVTTVYRFSTNIIPFTVASILDLNRDPLAALPVRVKQSKVYIGQAEPLCLSMFIPVHGFVPGQTIPIKIDLTNPSTVVVKKIRVVFKKVVTYHATEKSHKHKEIVVEVEQPVGKQSDTYDVSFDVPAVPPTGMIHCNIIDVLYTLKVETSIDVSEWYYRMFQKNLKLRTNLVIGTVPLQNYETPEKMIDMEEIVSPYPLCSSAIDEEKEEAARPNLSSTALYEKSQIYRSSKPDRDRPTGDEGDSDGEVKPYSPMYRVYKFNPLRSNVPVAIT